jgi:hypothetical protein
LNLTGQLSWFIKGDFISLKLPGLSETLFYIFLTILSVYILKEL